VCLLSFDINLHIEDSTQPLHDMASQVTRRPKRNATDKSGPQLGFPVKKAANASRGVEKPLKLSVQFYMLSTLIHQELGKVSNRKVLGEISNSIPVAQEQGKKVWILVSFSFLIHLVQ